MKKSIYKYFVMCARLYIQSNKLEAKSDRDLYMNVSNMSALSSCIQRNLELYKLPK